MHICASPIWPLRADRHCAPFAPQRLNVNFLIHRHMACVTDPVQAHCRRLRLLLQTPSFSQPSRPLPRITAFEVGITAAKAVPPLPEHSHSIHRTQEMNKAKKAVSQSQPSINAASPAVSEEVAFAHSIRPRVEQHWRRQLPLRRLLVSKALAKSGAAGTTSSPFLLASSVVPPDC